MIREQKRLWWKRKNLALSAWLLRNIRKEICDWKMYQIFWRRTISQLEPERESPKPKRLLSFQILSKKLFDEAQEMLKLRGQPERKPQNEPQPYCGLISCASCGMMITGEYKVKKQKNGNVHYYVYYRCTKKSKVMKCPEMSLRSEKLDEQLSSLIQKVSLPKDWAEELNRLALQDYKNSAPSLTACVKESETKL